MTTMQKLSADQQIETFYIGYYGAAADSEGFAKWEAKYSELLAKDSPKVALERVGNDIGLSKETKDLYPFLKNLPLNPHSALAKAEVTTFVDNVYQNLLGHAPPVDDPLLAKLIKGCLHGVTSLSDIVLAISNSATGDDLTTLQNKLTVATDFTTATTAAGLGFTSPTPAGYLAEAAAVVAATTSDPSTVTTQETAITAYIALASAVTFTLTTGADDFAGKPGADSTFIGDLTSFMVNGKGPTLNSDDILTGGTGVGVVNTLIINDSNSQGLDVIPAGAQISNIQDILLQTAGNAGGGAAFDTTGISGVVEVTVNSAGDGLDVVKAAAGVAITVDHTASSGAVTIIGGGAVTVTSAGGDYSGDTGILVGSGVNTGYNPTGAVDVTATSAAASVWVFGGTDVTIDTAAKNFAGSHGDFHNYTQVGANYATPSPSEPTGNVTVDDTGDAAIYVYGGVNVNVQSAGGFVQVGSDPDSSYTDAVSDEVGSSSGAVYAPAGTVTVTDAAAQLWSETTSYEEDVEVIGGTNVSVTTNTGAVNIGDDALNAAGTALLAGQNPSGNVTVIDTATNTLGYVYVAGGANVSVTTSGGSVYVGDVNTDNSTGGTGLNDVVSAVTGAVTIVDHAVATWSDTTGGPQEIDVIGGTTVNVTTNTASVYIGGFADDMTADNTVVPAINAAGAAFLAGQEPTGNVTVTDTASATGDEGTQIDVFGGANVTVAASGVDVNIGAVVETDDEVSNIGNCSDQIAAANDIVSAPTGAVTVTNTAALGYDGIVNDHDESVHVVGGTTVGVTTNSGGVFIGSDTGAAGSEASGNVTVTDTATSLNTEVVVYGGANVNVSSSAGLVGVGGSSETTNPTGSVTIDQSGVNTGYQYDNFIVVGGAGQGDSVTINTTGAGWHIDAPGPLAGILVGGNVLDDETPVTGAVLINDTYSGWQHDSIAVSGGTTVTINDTVSSENFIDVGSAPVLTDDMTLANGANDATGNVVIDDSSTFGSTTYYGSENFDVVTDGSTSVSVTGGDGCNSITDADTALQTAGIDAGQPVGASHLSSVLLDGVGGVTTVASDALTSLSIDNADCLTVDVINNTVNSSLTINLASDTRAVVEDESVSGYIGSVTVTATGAASDLLLDTPDATSVTFDNTAALTLDDCSDLANVVTITATGSGELTLGNLVDLANLTSVNASGASGGVQVQIDDGTTSFTGGSGDDVVSITSNTLGAGVTLTGGGGVNTLYADYAACVDDNPLGNLIGVSGFQNLGVVGYAEGTYSAEGFQGLIVGAYNPYVQGYQGVEGNIVFGDVAQGATLDLIDPSGACSVSYVLQNAYSSGGALSITDGVDTANGVAGTMGSSVAVDASEAEGSVASGITTLNIDSQGAGCVNVLEVDAPTVTKINISGDEALTLATDSAASVINASGSSGTVDVMGVGLAAGGVTVTGGSGLLAASGYSATNITSSVDVFNVGSGGGVITLGAGGAGYEAGTGDSTGSETVNLSPTAPVGTTIVAGADVACIGIDPQAYGSFGVVNGWTHGTIASGQTADSIVLSGTPMVIVDQSNIHEVDGAFYNVSDGVISLASGSPIPSATQQLEDAETIVDLGGIGSVGMITVNVQTAPDVTGPATFIIQDNGEGLPSVADTFVELAGVNGATGFGGVLEAEDPAFAGNVGAGTSIMLGGFSGYDTAFARVTLDNGGSATANETYTDAGYTIDSLVNSGAGFTNTYNNLANFGILEADTTGDGNVVVTQVGVDPILTLTAFGSVTVNDLTYGDSAIANDDPLVTLYSDLGSINITGDLIDASNTGTTLVISGANEVTVNGIIDTALTTINASTLDASLTLTAGENGLSIVGATADGDVIVASGVDDNISVGSDDCPASTCAYVDITANGSGDTISVIGGEFDGTTAHGINAGGSGDTITEAGARCVVEISSNGAALGANDTINVGDASVGHGDAYVIVGANSTVNIVGSHSCAEVNVENVATGATSSGSYAFTTITGMHGHDLTLDIGNASLSVNSWAGGCHAWDGFESQVNVATATSLANAIDIAASQAAVLDRQFNDGANTSIVNGVLELNAKVGLVDWFQYGGNTYIVDAINTGSTSAAHAGLGVHDEVIKLTGLVDANHIHMDFAGAV